MAKPEDQNQLMEKLQATITELTKSVATITQNQQALQTELQTKVTPDREGLLKILDLPSSQQQSPETVENFEGKDWGDLTPEAMHKALLNQMQGLVQGALKESLTPLTEKLSTLSKTTDTVDRNAMLRDFYATFPKAKTPENKEKMTRFATEHGINDPHVAYKAVVGIDTYDAELIGTASDTVAPDGLRQDSTTQDFDVAKGSSTFQIAEAAAKIQDANPGVSISPITEDVDPFTFTAEE